MSDSERPNFDEVYAYAVPKIKYFTYQFARDFPAEHREEIEQEALLRVWRAYNSLNRNKWKTFVYLHLKGAVIDYLRRGDGFKEISKNCVHIKVYGDEDGPGEEDFMARYGHYHESVLSGIDFDMLHKLISLDKNVYFFLKYLLGFSTQELSDIHNVPKEEIKQNCRKILTQIRTHKADPGSTTYALMQALGILNEYENHEAIDLPCIDDLIGLFEDNDIRERVVQMSFNFMESL